MANQNDVVNADVLIGGTALSRAGFGVALCADAGGSMSERVRFYESATVVATDLAAGDITAAQATHLTAALAQPKVRRVAAGRISLTPVAQVNTITVGGTAASGDYTITLNGTEYTNTATVPTDDNAAIATGLRASINGGSDPVTASGSGADIVLTADVAGVAFVIGELAAPSGATLTNVATTANVNVSTELDALKAASAEWFGLHLVSRTTANILAAAAWAENSGKLHVAQTSEAAVLASGSADVASQLKALGYARTHLRWYSVDATPMAFALLANRLAIDLETQAAPGWGTVRLSGVTADDAAISDTAKSIARSKRAGLYLTLFGQAATDSNAGGQRMSNNDFIDARILADWLAARITEDTAQLMLSLASLGKRIPYTDLGFAQLGTVAIKRMRQGIDLGHFEEAVDDQDAQISPYLTLPSRASLSAGQVGERAYAYSCGALTAGGVSTVQINGVLTDDLSLLAQLAAA